MASAAWDPIKGSGGGAVSALPAVAVIASYRGGSTYAPTSEELALGLGIVALALVSALIFLYVSRRRREPRPITEHWGALGVMGELCPHGWRARLNLFGSRAQLPDDAPPSREPPVELEWEELDENSERVSVARRLWAPTIADSLQAMVEDRRVDAYLEQIEQTVSDDAGPPGA